MEKIDKIMKMIIISSIALVSISISFYFIFYLPQRDKKNDQAKINNKLLLDICLQDAQETYTYNWNESCKSRGLGEGCRLESYQAISISESRENNRDVCFRKYKN